MRVVLGCVMAVLLAPSGASAHSTFLNPSFDLPSGQGFEVVDRLGTDLQRFWCDAGKAAKKRGAKGADRLYLLYPMGPSRTQPTGLAASFTLTPDETLLAAARSPEAQRQSLTVKIPGFNLSVASTQGYCVFELD